MEAPRGEWRARARGGLDVSSTAGGTRGPPRGAVNRGLRIGSAVASVKGAPSFGDRFLNAGDVGGPGAIVEWVK